MTTEIIKTKISSSKGNLAATIHYPEKKTEQLAILCPGYLDSKDYKHLVGLAETLCNQGYTVVRFDPTGVWESDGDISDYTTTQYLEDIKNVLEHMLRQADYKYVLLGGHSRGGQVVILYAARDPRISLVLAIMPSSKLTTKMGERYKDWMKTGVSISYRDLPNNREKKMEFRVPYSHSVDKDRYDVIQDVKKVKVPVIFISGELDDQCPPELVKEIFDNANEPKKFIIIPGIGHDYRFNDDEVKLVNKEVLKLIMIKRKVTVVIFYNDKNQILLQDRTGYKRSGENYGYFGGGIRENETPEEALVREIKEELNYDITDFRPIGVFSGKSGNLEVSMFTFISKINDISKFRQQEGIGMKFVNIETVEKLCKEEKMGGPWDYEALKKLKTIIK